MRRVSFLACFIAIFSAATAASAQTYVTFQPLAESGGQGSLLSSFYQSNDLPGLINAMFRIALSIGAIAAVLRIAWAGYNYMTSDAWGNKQHAKEVLGDVVLGLLLLLSIYLILYQINPNILKLDILKQMQPVPQATGDAPARATVDTGASPETGPATTQFSGGSGEGEARN